MTQVKSVVLARRPQGNPVAEDFQVNVSELPPLREGELLCRNHFVSLDAGFRNWMNEGSGDAVLPAMELGAPSSIAGSTASPDPSFIQFRNPASSDTK